MLEVLFGLCVDLAAQSSNRAGGQAGARTSFRGPSLTNTLFFDLRFGILRSELFIRLVGMFLDFFMAYYILEGREREREGSDDSVAVGVFVSVSATGAGTRLTKSLSFPPHTDNLALCISPYLCSFIGPLLHHAVILPKGTQSVDRRLNIRVELYLCKILDAVVCCVCFRVQGYNQIAKLKWKSSENK